MLRLCRPTIRWQSVGAQICQGICHLKQSVAVSAIIKGERATQLPATPPVRALRGQHRAGQSQGVSRAGLPLA